MEATSDLAKMLGVAAVKAKVLADLATVQHEVFGTNDGDCLHPFADYDRACELSRMLRGAIAAIESI